MDVLANARGVMSRHDSREFVFTVSRCKFRAIAVAIEIVKALIVRLPDLDDCGGNQFAARIENLSRNHQRHARIARRAERVASGSKPLIERAKVRLRSRGAM